ncbi:unnamed protein product [Meloidogyne enterolobii]|uniref:Uncharacterized protein n=1 Tax=Meloidogyne enterolobii TaxID=390850 RepID=A0ACB1A394_MELEN
MTSEKRNILTVEELPIYATKVADSQDAYSTERKPVFGEEYFRQLRVATNNFFGIPELNLSKVTETLEPVKDVASATEDFIRKENTELFPKLAAISWGGLGGYLYGRRKGFIKKYFSTSVGLLVMTAFCYPNETIRVVRTGFEHSKMSWEEFKKCKFFLISNEVLYVRHLRAKDKMGKVNGIVSYFMACFLTLGPVSANVGPFLLPFFSLKFF